MLSPMDQHVRNEALPIARHEFGHYIVAKSVGFDVEDVSIIITFPCDYTGRAEIKLARSITSIEETIDYFEKRIMILYAGVFAESLQMGKVEEARALSLLGTAGNPEQAATAAQDYAKARELCHLMRSLSCKMTDDENQLQAQLDAIGDKLWYGAIKIVEREAKLIEGLAGNLANRVTKSGVWAIISRAEIEALPAFNARFPN